MNIKCHEQGLETPQRSSLRDIYPLGGISKPLGILHTGQMGLVHLAIVKE
jgi:hypothetical protein